MPVNSTHPDYDANAKAWERARDVLAGEDAVKAAGTHYLPRLEFQTEADYLAYKQRAAFFNATARTADGFLGLIFRREPTFKLPEHGEQRSEVKGQKSGVGRALAAFVEDADMLGTSLMAYAKNVVSEVISVGRAGTLLDWEDQVEQRAYAVLYTAEQILNWRTERVNGRNVLTLLVLRERVTTDHRPQSVNKDGDEFAPVEVEQLRVLKLASAPTQPNDSLAPREGDASPTTQPDALTRHSVPPSPIGWEGGISRAHGRGTGGAGEWQYVVEIWRQNQEKNKRGKLEWEKVESRTPLRLGKPLPQIPFVFHGPRHSLPAVDKLPLADIIAVNLDHYRLNADYNHGLHFTALPTAWVSGFDKDATLHIGSSTAWVAEKPGASVGFLEFTGQGLTTFERALDRDERLMAVLGARMLEGQKRVAETAEAIELRQSGENSVLSTVSVSVSDSLTQVLRWVYWWNSTEETPEAIGEDRVLVRLNNDFTAKGMASAEIAAIVAAWQAGAISRETMFEQFRKGEVLPAGRTNEEEARLTAQPSPRPSPIGWERENRARLVFGSKRTRSKRHEIIESVENFDARSTARVERMGQEQSGPARRRRPPLRQRAQGDDDGVAPSGGGR